jgi:hypothetical protein
MPARANASMNRKNGWVVGTSVKVAVAGAGLTCRAYRMRPARNLLAAVVSPVQICRKYDLRLLSIVTGPPDVCETCPQPLRPDVLSTNGAVQDPFVQTKRAHDRLFATLSQASRSIPSTDAPLGMCTGASKQVLPAVTLRPSAPSPM